MKPSAKFHQRLNLASHADRAGIRAHLSGDYAKSRAFACAIAANQGNLLTFRYLKAKPPQG